LNYQIASSDSLSSPPPMRFSIFLRLVPTLFLVAAASSVFAADARKAASPNRPFVERVRPENYYDVEKVFSEPFSQTHDLVVLRTTATKPGSALAIKRAPGDGDYVVTLHFASTDAADGWIKINEELDSTIGQQVLRAVELKLHRQVALSNFKRTMSKVDTDIWVYQRLSDGRIAAALIATEATLNNPNASLFVDEFLGSLQLLIGKEGEERAALLQRIDRAATEIILAESP
jgi:hypothetical protein